MTAETLHGLPERTSRLHTFALEFGIEPDLISELIRLRGMPLLPDARAVPHVLSIYTLGRFEILRDQRPLRFEGKAQLRPLALLKAVIGFGGTDVPKNRLIDVLWADSLEGDVQKALDVTLYRLRKLLGHDRAIQVRDRRVSLNREFVWTDLWALEAQFADLIPAGRAQLPRPEQLEGAAPAVLKLYRGHFLDGEADSSWLLPVRNRLNGRFQRFAMRLGEYWEGMCAWSRAAELYERCIEIDPLAEFFYCRLIVCLREQGRRAEAIETFRRCRQILSVTLGIKPAESTEAVVRELMRP